MMQFKDHPIKIIKHGTWLNDMVSEKVAETLLRVNNWIEENELIVLNIETLFFPALAKTPESTGSALFKTGGGESKSEFYQVFRVWYKENTLVSNSKIDQLV